MGQSHPYCQDHRPIRPNVPLPKPPYSPPEPHDQNPKSCLEAPASHFLFSSDWDCHHVIPFHFNKACSLPLGKPSPRVNSKDFSAQHIAWRELPRKAEFEMKTHPRRSPVLLWLFASSVLNLCQHINMLLCCSYPLSFFLFFLYPISGVFCIMRFCMQP